jgi:hypothetical protein
MRLSTFSALRRDLEHFPHSIFNILLSQYSLLSWVNIHYFPQSIFNIFRSQCLICSSASIHYFPSTTFCTFLKQHSILLSAIIQDFFQPTMCTVFSLKIQYFPIFLIPVFSFINSQYFLSNTLYCPQPTLCTFLIQHSASSSVRYVSQPKIVLSKHLLLSSASIQYCHQKHSLRSTASIQYFPQPTFSNLLSQHSVLSSANI